MYVGGNVCGYGGNVGGRGRAVCVCVGLVWG